MMAPTLGSKARPSLIMAPQKSGTTVFKATSVNKALRVTDLKVNFRVKFCSRYTYPEVCATKNRRKFNVRCRNLASASPFA